MENESKSYALPSQTLPGLQFSDHLADLIEVRDFFESRGIQTKNTRIDRYIQYLRNLVSVGPKNESLVFKNSADGPFQSSIDWLLYVLREVHELMWILRGLKARVPSGLDAKLGIIVGGSDFAALDTNSQSRNVQFELRIASYFCQAGCDVDLTTDTDVIALTEEYAFYVECKRVGSMAHLQRRLAEAARQLHHRMPRKDDKRIPYGCVAADVTKAAFSHNGLTMGLTAEHSRDVVQEKLVRIANAAMKMPLFTGRQRIIQYCLQIHIPSLITHPPTAITRFSSFGIENDSVDGDAWRALKALREIFAVAYERDKRESPPRTLTRKSRLEVPKGTVFRLDDDLLREFLETGRVIGRKQDELVAELTLNGLKHEFIFSDLKMLVAGITKSDRKRLAKNVNHARLELVIEMYLQRYPYEDSEGNDEELRGPDQFVQE